MKFLKTFLAFTATLQAALLLIACSDSKITGTDEQANSITANLDSALAVWLSSDTLIAPKPQDTSVHSSYDLIIKDPDNPNRNPGVKVKNGTLYKNVDTDFESLTCGTDYCIAERGLFGTDTTSKTAGQKVHSCDLESAEHLNESRQYVDPNWKKYAELIVGICRE